MTVLSMTEKFLNCSSYPRKARAHEREKPMQERVSGNFVTHKFNTDLIVQYHPDQNDVGIGLELTGMVPGLHFIDVLYGDVPSQTVIGKLLFARLQENKEVFGEISLTSKSDDEEAEFFNDLGRCCLDAVTGSHDEPNSLWAWFDRPAINRLIRLLRKARDNSFGRDE